MLTSERRILMAILFLILPISCAQAGQPRVVDGLVTESIGNVKNAAAYFTVDNTGGGADRLTAVSAPAADRAELHITLMEDGVMKMRHVSFIEIPAGKTVPFQRDGVHIMLFGLKEPLKAGDHVALILTFEKAGKVTVDLPVRRR